MSVEYFFFLLKICISVRGLRLIQGRYTQTIGKRKKNGQLQHLGTFRQAEKNSAGKAREVAFANWILEFTFNLTLLYTCALNN